MNFLLRRGHDLVIIVLAIITACLLYVSHKCENEKMHLRAQLMTLKAANKRLLNEPELLRTELTDREGQIATLEMQVAHERQLAEWKATQIKAWLMARRDEDLRICQEIVRRGHEIEAYQEHFGFLPDKVAGDIR